MSLACRFAVRLGAGALALTVGGTAGALPQGGGSRQGGPPVAIPLTSQSPPAVEGTAAISGLVFDGVAKTPLGDAIVYLSVEGGGQGVQTRQLTDAKGRFAFVNLPAGTRYTVNGSKPGYLSAGYNRESQPNSSSAWIVVRDGEWVSDVRINLWRPAVIGGSVIDERGEPVAGVYVRLLTSLRVQGRDLFAGGPLTTTDDRGMYRLAGLLPGRYLVQVPSVGASMPSTTPGATPPRSGGPGGSQGEFAVDLDPSARLIVGHYPIPPPADREGARTYPPVFYPAAQSVSTATAIQVGYGDERRDVDIILTPVRAVRVSGIVEGPADALTNLTLRLIPAGLESAGQGGDVATARVDSKGRFTFLNVPSGSYTVDAPQTFNELTRSASAPGSGMSIGPSFGSTFPPPPGTSGWGWTSNSIDGLTGVSVTTRNYRGMAPNYWGRTSIVVGEHDEANLVVTMHQAGLMSGHVTTDLDPSRETPTTPPAVTAHLEPAAGDPALGRPGTNLRPDQASADFAIQGLLPGDYVLRLGTSWIAKSIRWNGRDYTDSTFNAAETQDFSGVEVVVTNAGAIVTGTVHDTSGSLASGVRVLIFPTDPALRTNQGFSPTRIKSIISASNGTFRISALPAGSYFAIALAATPETGWLDPDFLMTAERSAARVSVGWGETKSVELIAR